MNFERINIVTRNGLWHVLYFEDNCRASPTEEGICMFSLRNDLPDPRPETMDVLAWTLFQVFASEYAVKSGEVRARA